MRGAKGGIILFGEKAKEVLDKAKEASNSNIQLGNKEERWQAPWEVGKTALKNLGGSARIPK